MDPDRFTRDERISPATRKRSQHLRQEPTWTEAKLWERLRKLPDRMRRQAPIGPYVTDFACLRARLVIEVDGGIHNLTDVALRDLKRDTWLGEQGYRVLRIDSRRIPGDLESVVNEIKLAISAKVPLPLEGEGVRGRGEGTPSKVQSREAGAPKHHRLKRKSGGEPGSTPTQPSPLEGEGS